MPPGRLVGLLVDLKDSRPITISSIRALSSSGHPIDRNGAYKKRKIEPTIEVKPGTSFTLAQLKEWEMVSKANKKKAARQAAEKADKKKADKKKASHKAAVKADRKRGPRETVVVTCYRRPPQPPTMVNRYLLHGFEKEWKLLQEAAWAEEPPQRGGKTWDTVEDWTRKVCDALELWADDA
ncbi:uncharacterized protein RCC_10055 [Ramularia collo-cygni]|uniref:Uncharacterized protein n=1 Tax=Ramularia collo-cygni TaxID=112498 RepID=A0A2D3VGH7_9PEZI|nr:uncharacterized protein RCC_10055 [Ramularia collo-cygni]CZT24332.1 uncharacterized protein RCC_10055 [Ramularia collo-cygni]